MGATSKRWVSTLAGLGLVAFGAPVLAANAVTNGNFGTGDLSGWTTFETSFGTTGVGLPAVASFNTTGAGNANAAEFNVGVAVSAGFNTPQGGGISQVVDVLGGTYVFNAAIASLDDANGQINRDAGTFTLLVDGHAADAVTLGGFDFAAQVLRGSLVDTLVLGGGTHTIGIEITRDYFSSGVATPTEFVTDVSLTPVVSSVPEPGVGMLMLLGMTALGVVMARRARKG